MSIEEIERAIPMRPDQLFSHSQFVRSEIKFFDEAFVHNERFKEFEGLLRTNHKIYESIEAKFDLQKMGHLSNLANRLKQLSERLEGIGESHFTKDELDAMALTEMPTSEIVRQAEVKQRKIEEQQRIADGQRE